MPPRLLPLFLTLAVAFQSAAPAPEASAEDGSQRREAPARTDWLGDPLSTGVLSRLGTPRLWQPGAFTFTFSADGKTLAALDAGGVLRLWDVGSGKLLQEFATKPFGGYSPGMASAAFSPDDKLIALAAADGIVHVWDVAAGKEQYAVKGLPSPAGLLAFRPAGPSLVLGEADGSVEVWDLEKGASLARWGTSRRIFGVACAADGTVFAATEGTTDRRSRALWHWKVGAAKELSLQLVDQEVKDKTQPGLNYGGALSPDGSSFAWPTADGKTLRILDASSGMEIRRIEGAPFGLGLVRFAGDGRALTTASPDGTARIWETATGKLLHEFKALSTGFERVALSRDGNTLALMGRGDEAIHLWDVTAPRELQAFGGHRAGALTVAFSEDGKTVFTASRDSAHMQPVREWAEWSLRQWDPVTGKELHALRQDLGGEVHGAAFSPDARLLATLTHDGTLRLWDVAAGKELHRWQAPTKDTTFQYPNQVIKVPHPATTPPVFSHDGDTLFAAGGASLYRWDARKGDALPPLKTPGGLNSSFCFPSPDGATLLVTEWDGPLAPKNLVDGATGRVEYRLRPAGDRSLSPRSRPTERRWPWRKAPS